MVQVGTWLAVLKMVDENHDGNLSLKEFKNAVKLAQKIKQKEKN